MSWNSFSSSASFYELDDLSEVLATATTPLLTVDVNAPVKTIADAIKADCAQRRKEFDQRKKDYDRLLSKINKTISTEKVRLQLQEESHIFSTTVETLKSKPGVLEAKFSRSWNGDVDDDGSVFINKDGSTFDIVLNLLRGYPMPSHLSEHERESLESDLEYFGLIGLKQLSIDTRTLTEWVVDYLNLRAVSYRSGSCEFHTPWVPREVVHDMAFSNSMALSERERQVIWHAVMVAVEADPHVGMVDRPINDGVVKHWEWKVFNYGCQDRKLDCVC
jgi:hypothetical protein